MTQPTIISNIHDFKNIVINPNIYYIIQITSFEYNQNCAQISDELENDSQWLESHNNKLVWCKINSKDLFDDNNQELLQIFSRIQMIPIFFLFKGNLFIEYFMGGFKNELTHFLQKYISS
jgi:hypothetical protein